MQYSLLYKVYFLVNFWSCHVVKLVIQENIRRKLRMTVFDLSRGIQWNITWAIGKSLGLRRYFILYPSSRHNTVTILTETEWPDLILNTSASWILYLNWIPLCLTLRTKLFSSNIWTELKHYSKLLTYKHIELISSTQV